jgi:hypothetical protein
VWPFVELRTTAALDATSKLEVTGAMTNTTVLNATYGNAWFALWPNDTYAYNPVLDGAIMWVSASDQALFVQLDDASGRRVMNTTRQTLPGNDTAQFHASWDASSNMLAISGSMDGQTVSVSTKANTPGSLIPSLYGNFHNCAGFSFTITELTWAVDGVRSGADFTRLKC